MKKLLSLFAALSLVSAGCSTSTSVSEKTELDLSVDDFEPPTEVERGMETAGPFEHRLLTATSEDGITWERTNEILVEQGNAPDMMIKDGTIYLYYTGGNFDGQEEGIAVAISSDGGDSWTFKRVTISGTDNIHTIPGDPDIALRDDGSFRLYFTAQIDGSKAPSIQYADSTDGLNFTYEGETFQADGYTTIDSSAFYVDGHWAMLTFSGFGTEVIHAISSDDGDSFDFVKAEDVIYNKRPYFMANPLTLGDGSVRFYAFQLDEFRSFVTTDGLTWEDEGNSLLEYEEGENELEGFYIKDPSVVQLDDGTYLMIYVTRAPF